jgi:glycosyltransferase involved in cell wall biosynthesis
MKKIKILYVIPRLAKAGTEKHLLSLACGLDKTKFEVTICCLFVDTNDHEYPSLFFPLPSGKRVRVRGVNFISNCHESTRENSSKICVDLCQDIELLYLKRRSVYDLRIIFTLYKIIKRKKYDVVHTYLFGFHYLATIPARLAGVPLIISSRRELATWKKWHHRFLENLGNLFTDKVVACSNAAREFSLKTENLSPDKISVIYNGVDLEKFYPRPKDIKVLNELGLSERDKILGMVANFSAVKDHNTFLRAVSEVKKNYPDIKCLLIGDGPLREKLKFKVKSLGLENNIIFAGRRDDIPELLSIMDIFILTSLSEGLPNVILEAMASGLPVIATKVGGIPEVVENGKSGALVEPRDYPAIAGGIIRLLQDKYLRQEMGRRGRGIAEVKFSIERMVRDYENFYENLI